MDTIGAMRAPLFCLTLLALAACGGGNALLRSEVDARHVVVVGIEGRRVIIENLGSSTLELLRRAPTGEVVATTTLAPGQTYETIAHRRGAVEIMNRSGAAVPYRVEAIASEDGAARVVILGDRVL